MDEVSGKRKVCIQCSVIEFIRRIRMPVVTTSSPASASTAFEGRSELRVPIADQKSRPAAHVVQVHCRLPQGGVAGTDTETPDLRETPGRMSGYLRD
jgi:hypothetical protein